MNRLLPQSPWFFTLIAFALLTPLNASGESTRNDDSRSVDKSTAQWVKQAYAQTQTASSVDDYIGILETIQSARATEPSKAQTAYLNQLSSWCLVEIAKQPADSLAKIATERWKPLEIQPNPLLLCKKAIEADGKNWKAYAERAYLLAGAEKTDEAISDLDRAIRVNSKVAKLWFNRGELHYLAKKYELATADYSEAIKLDKADVQALTGRGHCYFRLGNLEMAQADYGAVVTHSPNQPLGHLNLGNVQLALKNYKQAGEAFREALSRDQSLADAYLGVAWMYATSENPKFHNPRVAEASIKRSIQLAGKETPENLIVLAGSQAASGNYSMARDTMTRVEKQLAKADSGRCSVVVCKQRLREIKAEKWFLAGTGKK